MGHPIKFIVFHIIRILYSCDPEDALDIGKWFRTSPDSKALVLVLSKTLHCVDNICGWCLGDMCGISGVDICSTQYQ